MNAQRTELEQWILGNLSPEPSSTAELMYERVESQSGRCLPVLYEPIDRSKRSHWHDEALIGAIAHAVGDAGVVLDVGPGDGWPALRIARRFERVIGIDPSPRRVRVQRENATRLGIENVEFLQMDVVAMDFPDASFGGVTAASSIEQSEDPEQALREVHRIVVPGGKLAMIFEDYETCLTGAGDEKLRAELTEDDAVVFYQVRRKSPARETWYALFLDRDRLAADAAFREAVEIISESPIELVDREGNGGANGRPEMLGVTLFAGLAPFTTHTKYFELHHLTSSSVDELLERVGFSDVRHLDHRLPELLDFYDTAKAAGKLEAGGPVFEIVAEVFGISAVERAGPGPGDFVVARKES